MDKMGNDVSGENCFSMSYGDNNRAWYQEKRRGKRAKRDTSTISALTFRSNSFGPRTIFVTVGNSLLASFLGIEDQWCRRNICLTWAYKRSRIFSLEEPTRPGEFWQKCLKTKFDNASQLLPRNNLSEIFLRRRTIKLLSELFPLLTRQQTPRAATWNTFDVIWIEIRPERNKRKKWKRARKRVGKEQIPDCFWGLRVE